MNNDEVFAYFKDGSLVIEGVELDFESGDTAQTKPREFALIFGAFVALLEAEMAISKAAESSKS